MSFLTCLAPWRKDGKLHVILVPPHTVSPGKQLHFFTGDLGILAAVIKTKTFHGFALEVVQCPTPLQCICQVSFLGQPQIKRKRI